MRTSYTKSVPNFHHIYRAYASKSQTNDTLVYSQYRQRQSSLIWLYRLPKTWDMWDICLGTKINWFLRNLQILAYVWHTSPWTAQCKCRKGIFADGTLTDVCVVYDTNHRYNSQKFQWPQMTVLVCARYTRYTRHILPFTNCSGVVQLNWSVPSLDLTGYVIYQSSIRWLYLAWTNMTLISFTGYV